MSQDERNQHPETCGSNAAPYVLGALTQHESEAFRRHLDTCTICREEVAALQVVASALPAAAPQITAPRDLKRRVMGAVHEDALAEAPPPRRPAAHRVPRWRPALGALAVACAFALLLTGVFASGGGGGGTRVVRAEVRAPGATALLRLQGAQAQLTISRLPQAPRGRVYQVWLKRSGGPQPTDALFTVSSRGGATVGVPGVGRGVREVMVTSEPLGGSLRPTRAPVIVARLG
ncbi:MAG TPA: anti-sigma factor [Solirubrobacteraceae bacterium]|jgi:anti-sigma-K factor RskA|nr:anti-sigma factor [Solirubrobacteraceae bacterium]